MNLELVSKMEVFQMMTVREILNQFDVKLNLTDELMDIKINDNEFQSHYMGKYKNEDVHVFEKKFMFDGCEATRKVIINPEKQILISRVESNKIFRNITTHYNKYGEIIAI